jgi:hypothetical protein
MARDDPQINIRMPAGLKSRLERQAAMNKRSATAEIVDRLHRSFRENKEPPKLVVRLEVLREGPAIEVPVLEFFRSMSKTLRDQIAQQLVEASADRADDRLEEDRRLQSVIEDGPESDAIVEKAAEETKKALRERSERLNKNAQERYRKRQSVDNDKPNE